MALPDYPGIAQALRSMSIAQLSVLERDYGITASVKDAIVEKHFRDMTDEERAEAAKRLGLDPRKYSSATKSSKGRAAARG